MSALDVPVVSLPAFVTVYQIAEWLQCSPQTVRNWSKRGVLPPPLALSRRKQLWDRDAVYAALTRLQATNAPPGQRGT
jgi:hypothetical protein